MWVWPGFELRVALRFLREGRMQTVLIIVGVAAGVAVIAYISALISGLQSNTLAQTLGAQAHITPRALRGEASQAVALMGVDLDRYDRVVGLRSKVVSGTARLSPGEAIVGRELASDLGVRVGDRLTVQTSGAGGTVSDSVRVTALVDLGVKDLNRRTVIVPLRAAQSLLALPGGASQLGLTLKDVWVAQALARELQAQFPYKIESWQESNAQLVSALNAQSISTSIIRG